MLNYWKIKLKFISKNVYVPFYGAYSFKQLIMKSIEGEDCAAKPEPDIWI